MVNEGCTAFLPRQLHVASSRSFIKRLPHGFFEKFSQEASLRS